MNIQKIIEEFNLTVLSGPFEKEISGGYSSDLLSDVLAHGKQGSIWVTIQVHRNVIAVASLQSFAAVIISGGRKPDEQTIAEAKKEELNLFSTQMSSYEIVGKLYKLGIPAC